MRAILSIAFLTLFAFSCDKPKEVKPSEDGTPLLAAVKDGVRAETEHDVTCGCALEAVGHCGDFIEIDGQYIPLQEVKLDADKFDPKVYKEGMLFCGKGTLKAKSKGEVKDGKYVATSFMLFKPVK